MEIWKDVKGYEGSYQVSNLGRVISFKFNKKNFLKGSLTKNGYLFVGLSCKNKTKQIFIHQLVAISFLNHTPCGLVLVVDHINDVKTDNSVENLQIVTQRFNVCKTQGSYSSQYKGVHWSKKNKKWKSQIRLNGKQKYLGYFTDEKEASEAYQKELLTV
jgi:hypothetical protein